MENTSMVKAKFVLINAVRKTIVARIKINKNRKGNLKIVKIKITAKKKKKIRICARTGLSRLNIV
jgi:hypothetical protein